MRNILNDSKLKNNASIITSWTYIRRSALPSVTAPLRQSVILLNIDIMANIKISACRASASMIIQVSKENLVYLDAISVILPSPREWGRCTSHRALLAL